MKSTVLLILTSLFFTVVYAQSEEGNDYLSFAAGVSLPRGEFADISSSSLSNSGFATTGFHVNCILSKSLSKNFGLTAMISSNTNPVDDEAINSIVHDLRGQELYTTTGQWFSVNVLAGAAFYLPVSSNFELDFRLLGGYASTSSPSSHVSNGTSSVWQDPGKGSSFCLNVGGGLKYSMNYKYALVLGADYYTTNTEIEVVVKRSGTYYEESRVFEQSIGMWNISLGIAFIL